MQRSCRKFVAKKNTQEKKSSRDRGEYGMQRSCRKFRKFVAALVSKCVSKAVRRHVQQ
jgi:hypothetical protein